MSPHTGLPADSTINADLHPSGGDQAHHLSCQKSSPTTIRTEELRVCVPHPGGDVQCPRPALQQLIYPVPKDSGELDDPKKKKNADPA